MKKLVLLVLLAAIGSTWAQEKSLKVFLDSENPNQSKGMSAKIVSLSEITERFMKACPDCVVTIKKESADYVVSFAASQGWTKKSWSWIVYENKEGTVVKKGETSLFNNSIKDAVQALTVYHAERTEH
jgi:hypothetical protein